MYNLMVEAYDEIFPMTEKRKTRPYPDGVCNYYVIFKASVKDIFGVIVTIGVIPEIAIAIIRDLPQ